eukprot:3614193-Pleurochrysis_carterae.AAC.7
MGPAPLWLISPPILPVTYHYQLCSNLQIPIMIKSEVRCIRIRDRAISFMASHTGRIFWRGSERLERYERLGHSLRSLCHWCPGVGRHATLIKDYRTTAQRQKQAKDSADMTRGV